MCCCFLLRNFFFLFFFFAINGVGWPRDPGECSRNIFLFFFYSFVLLLLVSQALVSMGRSCSHFDVLYIHTYIYIYICVCVCVCACMYVWKRQRNICNYQQKLGVCKGLYINILLFYSIFQFSFWFLWVGNYHYYSCWFGLERLYLMKCGFVDLLQEYLI